MAHGGGSGVARCGRLRYGGKHLVPADHGSKEAIMPVNRREFLHRLAGGVAAGLVASAPLALAATRPPINAIAFDAFPIVDPRPVFALAEHLFPGHGAELSNTWRTRQFEYTWLRTVAQRYADFWRVTEDALGFAATMLKLDLSPDKRRQLMDAYLQLKAWPDVLPALKTLKEAGIRLVFLSNFTPKMLDAAITSAGLEGLFEHVLSTDQVNTYKPDPRAYQLAIDALRLPLEEILFVPFAGWDAAGAKWFGYRTFWVNRLNLPQEELGVTPDATGGNLADLLTFVRSGS
jgi:2-haloacid dehalogenase